MGVVYGEDGGVIEDRLYAALHAVWAAIEDVLREVDEAVYS